MFVLRRLSIIAILPGLLAAVALADGPADNQVDNVRPVPPKGSELPPAVRAELAQGLAELQALIKEIGNHELLPDVLIYEKAVRWALDFNEVFDGKGGMPGGAVKAVLKSGLERAKALKAGQAPWTTQTGTVVRGYRSKIDGSVQPYGLVIPADYDFQGEAKHRLDFWWHGRGETLSEASFINDRQKNPGQFTPASTIVLHPYGRYCNANKFAGEIDTLECLEDVKKHYRIDANRIVARGFSMGGAACWQFAVHYPTLWCAAAPGAGFAETPEFLNVFQNEKVEPTWYEKKLWHMYNATDYAVNIYNLPTVAYSGEIDRQKQAADVMDREMQKEGLTLTHIIGPKTAHSYEKGAKEEVSKRIDAIAAKGLPAQRPEIKFVTYTLRYNQCGWVTVQGLEKHWDEARITGRLLPKLASVSTKNVNALTVTLPIKGPEAIQTIAIDGMDFTHTASPANFRKTNGKWQMVPSLAVNTLQKAPGLQGPIDDAFMDSFLMVKPTGTPMNAEVGKWVNGEMKHATDHWRKQFRGDAPVKDDTAMTDTDIKNSNLILWGDPKSNAVLARIADKLPIQWSEKGVTVGDKTYPAGSSVPVLIYPNPLNPQKYVVLNSGFTFREYDYLNNARQVSKLPDYAVIDITTPPNSRYPGKIVRAGFFGEKWELQPNDGQ